MRELYPEFEPAAEAWLPVGAGHEVRYELSGSEDGIPVVFLHGGPGSGCKPYHRRFFDPARYRIVLFDQRGTGGSRPFGGLQGNDTGALLADMEALRQHLGVDRWVVFGGSWGATLALLYAEQHPDRVAALVLRGTFLARDRDLNWYFGDGLRSLYPDEWSAFDAAVPSGIGPIVDRAADAVLDGDEETALKVALAWERFSGEAVSFALPQPLSVEAPDPATRSSEDLERLLKKSRIEMHYARNRYFIRDNQILDEIGRVPAVPVTVIHGRRDVTCLPDAGWSVHRALPGSELRLVHTAGHLATEPGNVDALIQATERIAAELEGGGGRLRG